MRTASLIAMILALASSALAVEVAVKNPTKLYDSEGQVLADVQAGQTFKADRLTDNYVYGFLRTDSGGVRGWIPLAALDLDDDTKRALAEAKPTQVIRTPRPTERSDAEPKSYAPPLRYRLEPGELQVYEATAILGGDFPWPLPPGTRGRRYIKKTTTQVTFSILGKRRTEDGTLVAEVRYHKFQWEFDAGADKTKPSFRFDENGLRQYRDGKWGEPDEPALDAWSELQDLVDVAVPVKLHERGGLVDDKRYPFNLYPFRPRQMCGVGSLLGTFPTYPEHALDPGHTWAQQVTYLIQSPYIDGSMGHVTTQAQFKAVSRLVHRNRLCMKLLNRAESDKEKHDKGYRHEWYSQHEASGILYIEEATGIPLELQVKVAERRGDADFNEDNTRRYSGHLTITYKGNKLE